MDASFTLNRKRPSRGYIPSQADILETLRRLAELSRANDGREAETGRLIVVEGRYGYLCPINPLAKSDTDEAT